MSKSMCAGLILAFAAPAAAQSFTATFENGVNAGGWTMVGGPGGAIQGGGGNPGAYFGGTNFNYPDFQTREPSELTGDYYHRFVQFLEVDLITFQRQGALLPLTVMLVNDGGTPQDPTDDWGAYFTGPDLVPAAGAGWKPFRFFIDSISPEVPQGWVMHDIGPNPPPGRGWTVLMRDVSQIRFMFAPPGTISNFPVWNAGMDNARIVWNPPDCYANCDGSTAAPVLNVNDFVCFMGRYAAQDPYANCDGSTAPPVFNVNDFVCFQTKFAAGCP